MPTASTPSVAPAEQIAAGRIIAIDTNPALIRRSLERRWDVEDIHSIGWKEIAIKKSNDGYEVKALYNVEQPFIANVFLLVKFDKSVVIQQ